MACLWLIGAEQQRERDQRRDQRGPVGHELAEHRAGLGRERRQGQRPGDRGRSRVRVVLRSGSRSRATGCASVSGRWRSCSTWPTGWSGRASAASRRAVRPIRTRACCSSCSRARCTRWSRSRSAARAARRRRRHARAERSQSRRGAVIEIRATGGHVACAGHADRLRRGQMHATKAHDRGPGRAGGAAVALVAGCASANKTTSTSASERPRASGGGSMAGMNMGAQLERPARRSRSTGSSRSRPRCSATADWQGMKITAQAMTAVPFVIFDGTNEQMVKPATEVELSPDGDAQRRAHQRAAPLRDGLGDDHEGRQGRLRRAPVADDLGVHGPALRQRRVACPAPATTGSAC